MTDSQTYMRIAGNLIKRFAAKARIEGLCQDEAQFREALNEEGLLPRGPAPGVQLSIHHVLDRLNRDLAHHPDWAIPSVIEAFSDLACSKADYGIRRRAVQLLEKIGRAGDDRQQNLVIMNLEAIQSASDEVIRRDALTSLLNIRRADKNNELSRSELFDIRHHATTLVRG